MTASFCSKPFLGACSTGSLHSPSLLLSRNIIHLPDRRSQLKRRLGLTIGSPIKFYSETSPSLGCKPSRRAYCLSSKQDNEISVYREASSKVSRGVIGLTLLKNRVGADILTYVSQVHNVVLPESLVDPETLTYDQIKGSTIRCPNPEYAEKMVDAIEAVRLRGDSVGGTVTCIVRNFPWSYEAFPDIAAVLAEGVMSLPATEGFEIGRGFTGTFMTGSEHIDESRIKTRKNTARAQGDLDFCTVPRAVYLVEAMVAQVLVLHMPSPTNAAAVTRTPRIARKCKSTYTP